METYLFYDIETTGLSKSFDQVLQFAAIRTDLNLNELERHEFKVKLNPDSIPAPKAIITHHIGIHAHDHDLCEYQAIQQIHALLNVPGTISLGYNTLGFDDEFLRFSFYRNLLAPYSHQYANRCSRMDLYPVVVMYFLFKKAVLNWPTIDGAPTLKLEHINAANQLASGAAHNAMVDVEVTLALARRLITERDMWDYVLGYFNKKIDKDRCDKLTCDLTTSLGPHPDGLLADGIMGHKNYYQAPVLGLGEHNVYKNQTLWLRLDTPSLNETTANTIAETTWVIRKKWAESSFILPTKERFLTSLGQDRQSLASENKAWLKANPAIFHEIINYYRQFVYPSHPAVDAQSNLYLQGFWSREEEQLCANFHRGSLDEKLNILPSINNPTLKTLATRIVGRNYPEASQHPALASFRESINQLSDSSISIIDFKGHQKLMVNSALSEALELASTELSLEQRTLLGELTTYLTEKFLSSSQS